jgi:hypothetical protein
MPSGARAANELRMRCAARARLPVAPPHSIAKDHHGAGSLQVVQQNSPGFAEALDRLLRGPQQVSCQRPGTKIEQFGQHAHWQTDVASVEEFELRRWLAGLA